MAGPSRDGDLRLSLDGNVRYSLNPMRQAGLSDNDAHKHFDAPEPSEAAADGWATRGLMQLLPRTYFHPDGRKLPVAPPRLALASFAFEVITVAAVFSGMCWYFRTSPTQQTTITLVPLPGHTCSVLNPRKDTNFYSAEHSENAQFASPYMTSTECVSLLTRLDVCGDGRRLDHVTLWGVSHPNNTHYSSPTSTGSQGYFSFTPSQTPGLATQLVPFFQPSVSFPKPDISRSAFLGSNLNWYLFNFANNTAADAFMPVRGVPASTFMYDASTNIVYDPDPTVQQRDYDLSSSTPNAAAEDVIRKMGEVTGKFDVGNIGVNSGVYYGLRGAAAFNRPYGVAVDAAGNVFVADTGNNMVRRIDAKTQAVTSLGTSARPDFSYPEGVAVDAAGNVYVADWGNDLVRRIDAKTQAVTSLGTSARPAFNRPEGVAVDTAGNVYVTDTGNRMVRWGNGIAPDTQNKVRRIDAKTQAVTSLGTSARPAFIKPEGVAVDAAGNVFVADTGNNMVRRIDAKTQAVTSLGTSARPAFDRPEGVAVDTAGNVYVTDTRNWIVRRIDAKTQAVTSLGTSARPAFSYPEGVAVDKAGNVYVTGNNMVRRIDAKTQAVTRYVGAPRVLSWDMRNPDPNSFTLWPDTALYVPVDSASGGCQNVDYGKYVICYLLGNAEVSPADGRIYLEFQMFQLNAYWNTCVYILDPAKPSQAATSLEIYTRFTSSRQLWGVFNTPRNGTVLLMAGGVAKDNTPYYYGKIQYLDDSPFTHLVTAAGTSIVDASAIPSKTPGEPARFLLLTLREKGLNTMYTYDAFTDTIASSNAAAAATTHAMLAFTWGVCDGSVTRSLVELSFSNAFSNECPLPKTGLYYQSPNVYYAIPYACLGIAYDKLLTDCAELKANMRAIVDASCPASLAKVCRQQYDLNPPFSCVTDVYPSALTVISLSGSNAMAVSTLLALVVAALLARAHRHYRPSEQDIALANARPFNHYDANDKPSVSGPGIEMLSPLAKAWPVEIQIAQLQELVSSLSASRQQEQQELKQQQHEIKQLHQGQLAQQQQWLHWQQQQHNHRLPVSAYPALRPQGVIPPPAQPQSAETPGYDQGASFRGGRLPH